MGSAFQCSNIPSVFSSFFIASTDSPHLTFSEARPPTSLLASEIVRAVDSASCWHFNFAAVALSKEAVSSAKLASSSYTTKKMKLNKLHEQDTHKNRSMTFRKRTGGGGMHLHFSLFPTIINSRVKMHTGERTTRFLYHLENQQGDVTSTRQSWQTTYVQTGSLYCSQQRRMQEHAHSQ